MLKRTYKILKYIHKNPNISKSKLLKKFSDFEKYQNTVSEYIVMTDTNKFFEQDKTENLIIEAEQLGLNMLEVSDFIKNHSKESTISHDDSLVFYSTNLKFDEYLENKKHKDFLFWVPYTITTILAIASLIVQFLT